MKKVISIVFAVLILSTSAYADNRNVIVHRTVSGECYHSADCSFLRSDIEITLEEAVKRGLRACSYCDPPKPNFSKNSASNNNSSAGQSSQHSTIKASNGWPLFPTVAVSSAVSGMFFYEVGKEKGKRK